MPKKLGKKAVGDNMPENCKTENNKKRINDEIIADIRPKNTP